MPEEGRILLHWISLCKTACNRTAIAPEKHRAKSQIADNF